MARSLTNFYHEVALEHQVQNEEDEEAGMVYQKQIVHLQALQQSQHYTCSLVARCLLTTAYDRMRLKCCHLLVLAVGHFA